MQVATAEPTVTGDVRAPRVLRNWARSFGLSVVVLGVAVMVGWALNIEILKQVTPSLVSMKFNTALCLALLGAGVVAGSHSTFARAVSLTAVIIAAVSLVESATGWSAGIDELVFRDSGSGPYPGRMAITTAICLCLGGAALLARHAGRRRVATTLALTLLAIAWLACLGYLFGVQALYRVSPFSTMAGHTAVACLILAVGLMANNAGGLLPWIVRSEDPGATLLRIILPTAFIGLPIIAEIRLQMQHAGWFGTEFGLAVMVVVSSTALAAVSVIAARAIDRSHQARLRANDALRELNANLESTVQERTTVIATSETWARALAGSAPIGIFRTDEEGLTTYVNDRLCTIYDVTSEQLLGNPWDAMCHEEDRGWARAEWLRSMAEPVEFDAEFRVLLPAGGIQWVHLHAVAVPGVDGSGGGHVGTVADITEGRASAVALGEAEELFRTSFESSPTAIALLDGDDRIVQANRALCDLVGYRMEELLTRTLDSFLSSEERPAHGSRGSAWPRVDQRLARADGSVAWVSIRYARIRRESESSRELTVTQIVDISERRRFEDQLTHTANHDPLTGLLNRRSFEVSLADHVLRCKRYGAVGAVLMIDLDHFKTVNDTHGHAVGDEVLIGTADALRRRLRASDVIARIGGDEFVALLPAGSVPEARAVARSIVEVIRTVGPTIAGSRIPISASVGFVAFDTLADPGEEGLLKADMAMYEAKNSGGDTWAGSATDPGPGDRSEPRPAQGARSSRLIPAATGDVDVP